MIFYVDGSPFGTRTVNGQVSTSSLQNIWIGQDQLVNSTFNGTISNLKIWDIALSQQQLNQRLNRNLSEFPHLIAFWKLNEGTGQNVIEHITGY